MSDLQGTVLGTVWPPGKPISGASVNGRKTALRTLKRYVTNLTFFLPGTKGGPSLPFVIKPEDFHVEQPKNVVELVLPSIVVIPGSATDDEFCGPVIDESTRDRFGKGTALWQLYEHVETITLECWAKDGPQRSSIMAGLEAAMIPTEERFGALFRMPDYYDQTVRFVPKGTFNPDDPDSVRNRKWGHVMIEMSFNVAVLKRVVEFQPEVVTEADDTGSLILDG